MNQIKKLYSLLFAGLVMGLVFLTACEEAVIFQPQACFTMVRDSAGVQTDLAEGDLSTPGKHSLL